MNVLLAEADIPYDKLLEMDEINGDFRRPTSRWSSAQTTSPIPRRAPTPTSPIYGMPILDADKARTVMVIKRSMSPGFAGIDNELYYMDKTLMLFGDAKNFCASICKELTSSH